MAPTTSRMSYTNEHKMEVVKRGLEIGYRPAGKEYGIPEGNVRHWAKELNAISHAPMNRRIARARNGTRFPEIETEVCAFIQEKRNGDDGFRFSMSHIC